MSARQLACIILALAALVAASPLASSHVQGSPLDRAPEEGLHFTSPANGTHWNVRTIAITWKVVSPSPQLFTYEVKVDDGSWILNWSSTSITLSSLEEGWHRVEVVAHGDLGARYGGKVEFEVDTLPPTVTSYSPTGEDVPLAAEIMVTFSEDMQSVQVHGVTGAITWGVRGFALTPDERFLPGERYTIMLNGSDLAGNNLNTGWSFRATDKGTVTGVVRDERNHTVGGARVALLSQGAEVANTTTDDYGEFSLRAPQGSYRLEISSPGIATRTLDANLTPSATLDLGVIRVESAPDLTWVWVDLLIIVGAVGLIFVGRRRGSLKKR